MDEASPDDRENIPALPPGQFAARAFVRFGLGRFRNRKVVHEGPPALVVTGRATSARIAAELAELPRVSQVSDFHCVTTWSRFGVQWQGVRFSDFCDRIARPSPDAALVVFHGLDGYRCALPLEDLRAPDVLLADRLDGEPLGLEHGGPLRLVAPAHYGYKSVKHLASIEFRKDRRGYRFPFPYPGLMDHPRARVAFEERARFVPNWLIRPIYRLFLPAEIR